MIKDIINAKNDTDKSVNYYCNPNFVRKFLFIYEDIYSYFKELKNALLGVVIVIMGTASIVVYQYFLENNNEKNN